MTDNDQSRLAQIRAHYATYEANPPPGYEHWEVPFLLLLLDEALKRKAKVEG